MILSEIERKYYVKLPRKVLALDYGRRGDLYIRFKHVEKPIGEPTKDGLVIFFCDDGKVIAVEVMDISKIGLSCLRETRNGSDNRNGHKIFFYAIWRPDAGIVIPK